MSLPWALMIWCAYVWGEYDHNRPKDLHESLFPKGILLLESKKKTHNINICSTEPTKRFQRYSSKLSLDHTLCSQTNSSFILKGHIQQEAAQPSKLWPVNVIPQKAIQCRPKVSLLETEQNSCSHLKHHWTLQEMNIMGRKTTTVNAPEGSYHQSRFKMKNTP